MRKNTTEKLKAHHEDTVAILRTALKDVPPPGLEAAARITDCESLVARYRDKRRDEDTYRKMRDLLRDTFYAAAQVATGSRAPAWHTLPPEKAPTLRKVIRLALMDLGADPDGRA